MKSIAYFFPAAAFVVLAQSITGSATVLGFYDFGAHMNSGYLTGVVVLVAMIIAFASKPKYNALRYASVALFALVVLQGLIGFAAETSDQVVLDHFTNAHLVYGVSIAIVFYAFRWGRMEPQLAPKQA